MLSGLFSWIIPIFLPQSYVEIQFIITACLLGPLFYTLSETTAVGIAIVRKTKLAMLASIVAMLVNLVANYFLVPLYGAGGAAISTAIAFWCFYVVRTELAKIVWRRSETKKIYIITLLLLILSGVNALIEVEVYILFLMWIGAMFIGLYLFKNPSSRLVRYVIESK